MAKTHIPIQMFTPTSGDSTDWSSTTFRAECAAHQWAVADGGYEAVEALVREHVREHPTVHCASPPRIGPYRPTRHQRWRVVQYMYDDGTSAYTGSCGLCTDPRWDVFDSAEPVDACMEEHWVAAHAADYDGHAAEGNHG